MHAKADLVKRFLAALIDGLLAGVIGFVLGLFGTFMGGVGTLIGAFYILVRDGIETPYTDGRSVGKKVIGLRPVTLDGAPMTVETSVRRNWTIALGSLITGVGSMLAGMGLGVIGLAVIGLGGFAGLLGLVECVLVIIDKDGRRIGDKTGNTQVIEALAAEV